MYRSWAGATAALFAGLFGISGVFAEGMGSSLAPVSNRQVTSADFFAHSNLSSRRGVETLTSGPPVTVLSRPGDGATSRRFAFMDFASTSSVTPYGAQWTPMSNVINVSTKAGPQLTDARTAVDTYFGAFEAISKQPSSGVHPGAGSIMRPAR